MPSMISIPGSLSFETKLMMSSASAKSAGDPRSVHCPIQSRLQSVLGVRSYYVERNKFLSFFFSFVLGF